MIKKITLYLLFTLFFINGCGIYKRADVKDTPINVNERVKKNIEEGRGVSIKSIVGGRGGNTNYEFSTSNPMWRASLEVLDFIPMATVDYSGGMIISDWYSDNSTNSNESIKITVRFLSNEIRSDSVKIIIHKKLCKTSSSCSTSILNNSTIGQELRTTIIRRAALLEKEDKEKK